MIYTDNLNLFKYDLDNDQQQVFDVKLCLNDNWDKIDGYFTNFETSMNTSIQNLQGQIDTKINKSGNATVTKYTKSGTNILRKWSDGFLEQWGRIDNYKSNSVITLTSYSNANYQIQISFGGTSDRNQVPAAHTKTASSFKVKHTAGLNNGFCLYYYVCGY